VQRANALLLAEAYRPVAIKEDGRMVPVTALQAVLRSQIELAINGNYRAQRDVLEAVQHIELLLNSLFSGNRPRTGASRLCPDAESSNGGAGAGVLTSPRALRRGRLRCAN
jgi:hypothetical protein